MSRDLAMRIAVSALIATTACSYNSPGDGTPDSAALPTVQFATASSVADEKVTDHKIKVTLSEPSTSTVDFRVTGGLAAVDNDFVFIGPSAGGTLTFSGDSQDIEVRFTDDGLEEPAETLVITLENPQGATLGTAVDHTVTISPSILPRVRFPTATTIRDEDQAGAALDLALDIAPTEATGPVSVDLVLAGGATAIADYGLTPQTVTFAIGQTAAQFDYAVVADTRDELDELIAVDLQNPVNVVIDSTAAHTEHTIRDDDATPTVSFVSGAATLAESGGDASPTVQLSAASNLPITVDFVQSGSAVANDITGGGNGTLTFAPGETSQPIPLAVVDDARDEANTETVVLTLGNPTNATLAAPGAHTLSITDNDTAPSVTFGAASTAATEGGAALVIPVNLVGNATDLTVTVDFARAGTSSATAAADFTFDNAATTLTFAPGDTTQNILVTIVDDAVPELAETLDIALSNIQNATAGAITTHAVAIADDDCLGSGVFQICPTAAPAGTVNLSGAFDTDSNAACAAQQPLGWIGQGQPSSCFVVADVITVQNAGLTVTGGRPLVLVAATSITVVGAIDGSATGSTDGPGGASSLCKAPTAAAESSSNGGGGGAGGSFMTKAGNGGTGDNNSNSANGSTSPAADGTDPVVLRGGCRGAAGGTGPGERGTGGAAGGAIYLAAPAITIGNKIDVSGSGGLGGGFDAGGGGGGGSGGMILIDATTLTFSGTLMANGGGGGQGADNNTSGEAGEDPATFNVSAPGGNVGGAGGAGGRGHSVGTGVQNGSNGGGNQGAGGGGGAGGFIRSTQSLAGGNVSAGKVVQN